MDNGEMTMEGIIFGLKAELAEALEENKRLKQQIDFLEIDNIDYKDKIAENELVSIDWHNEQVLHLEEQCQLLLYDFEKQKAETERLTEELDLANETIDRNNKRYKKVSIERQKALDRVDFLEDALLDKIRRNEELITAIKQAEQQAVKDTAKEIYDFAKNFFTWDEEGFVRELKEFVQDYGVEVE